MKKLFVAALAALSLLLAGAATVIYGGFVDVAADVPHSTMVHQLIEAVRESSVERSSRDIVTVKDLSDPERIRRGAGNYDAMCVMCHLAPAMVTTEIRQGLYPEPMNLTLAARSTLDEDRARARQFWIIKRGIKASGMPAWGKGGMDDESIWDLVAFLKQLPALTPEQYGLLVKASDGHSHGGLDSSSAPDGKPAAQKPDSPRAQTVHDHSTHKHAH